MMALLGPVLVAAGLAVAFGLVLFVVLRRKDGP